MEVDGIFAHKDSYTDDIIKLTETWQKERDEYPVGILFHIIRL